MSFKIFLFNIYFYLYTIYTKLVSLYNYHFGNCDFTFNINNREIKIISVILTTAENNKIDIRREFNWIYKFNGESYSVIKEYFRSKYSSCKKLSFTLLIDNKIEFVEIENDKYIDYNLHSDKNIKVECDIMFDSCDFAF
jgi:hypothetical protein